MGKLEAIWIKRFTGGPMDAREVATLIADKGIVGNANFGARRQVTVIERETFERIRETLSGAEPSMRRANLMVSGIRLEKAHGRVLTVGRVRILLKGETRPCLLMDEQCPGLQVALEPHWGGGAHGMVLDGGEIRVGDEVSLAALETRQVG
jgi:MOSC domain-containing protein YiiM